MTINLTPSQKMELLELFELDPNKGISYSTLNSKLESIINLLKDDFLSKSTLSVTLQCEKESVWDTILNLKSDSVEYENTIKRLRKDLNNILEYIDF